MVLDGDEEFDRILQKNFTSSFRKGYIKVKGVTMPLKFAEMHEEIENWDVDNEDIWICSFPKTGTTWTQEMVWMIANGLDFEGGQVILGQRSPFLEASAVYDFIEMMENDKNFQPPPFLADSLGFTKSLKGKKLIKTHLPLRLLPKQIRDGTKKPKIIYIARNPKDTCVSYYHHCKLMEGYRGDFEEFCRLFLAGKLSYTPYWDHVLQFWQHRDELNLLFLKYEDLKADLPKIIRKVADFLNSNLTDEQIETLNKHLSFESMKANKSVNFETLIQFNRKHKFTEHDSTFMRSGRIGDFNRLMTPEIVEKFDSWTNENLKDSDFSF